MRAGTAGYCAGADYARSQGTSQDTRGRGKGNGPLVPRCQHRAPPARRRLWAQSSSAARSVQTLAVGRGASPLRSLSSGRIVAARGGGRSAPPPEQESYLTARRHFRHLHSPTLLTVLGAWSRCGRAGEALPLGGRRLRKFENWAWAGRPSSCRRTPTLRHPAPSPSHPPTANHPPALGFRAARVCGAVALLPSPGASTLSSLAPGSALGDSLGSSTPKKISAPNVPPLFALLTTHSLKIVSERNQR